MSRRVRLGSGDTTAHIEEWCTYCTAWWLLDGHEHTEPITNWLGQVLVGSTGFAVQPAVHRDATADFNLALHQGWPILA